MRNWEFPVPMMGKQILKESLLKTAPTRCDQWIRVRRLDRA
jgi:hypothetical protein